MTLYTETQTTEAATQGPIRKKRLIPTMLALSVIVTLGYLVMARDTRGNDTVYITAPVSTGDLSVVVSATGNLQPTTQVDIGSELSGTIKDVFVNDNDSVKKDQVLARLDTARLEDQVFKSEAALTAAQAAVALNEAAADEAQIQLGRLKKTWELSGGKIPSKSDITTAEATLKKTLATVDSVKAAVTQAEAALRSDKTNLAKADIKSPIDGIVLLRKVEPGQTVAASLQAPVLFVLAQNLQQMELQAEIDEADVGQVKEGQDAEFTVDAYPARRYPAKITRIRYGSETNNGVVTYQGVLAVANDDLSLRPGMTATATISTLTRQNVMLVPNAALRYTPDSQNAGKNKRSVVSFLIPRPPANTAKKASAVINKGSEQTVWVLQDGEPAARIIKTGATDGRQTEILSGALTSGEQVITDTEEPKK